MNLQSIDRVFHSPWRFHVPCCFVALLACALVLCTSLPESVAGYAATVVLAAFVLSFVAMAVSVVRLFFQLRNARAIFWFLAWLAEWGVVYALFALMAVIADVPPPAEESARSVQETDTLHLPNDVLTGPSSLVISMDLPGVPDDKAVETKVAETPNLLALERDHEGVLPAFLQASTRWSAREKDDAFYSHPGHVVLVPVVEGVPQGLVHACFRELDEGEPVPRGYVVVKGGEPFPEAEDGAKLTDIAIDLGRRHYLLLAWRGSVQVENLNLVALNAAISTLDMRFKPLADSPTPETISALAQGSRKRAGSAPEIRVSEPPAQYGAYQAEVDANPQEAGTLLLYVQDLETKRTLRILSCPAMYSPKADELFRHDFPGPAPKFSSARTDPLLPVGSPLFSIREGDPHGSFGVALQVVFEPAASGRPVRLLLRRCYKVHACEKVQPAEVKQTPVRDTPDELAPTKAEENSKAGASGSKADPAEQETKPAASASPEATATASPSEGQGETAKPYAHAPVEEESADAPAEKEAREPAPESSAQTSEDEAEAKPGVEVTGEEKSVKGDSPEKTEASEPLSAEDAAAQPSDEKEEGEVVQPGDSVPTEQVPD